MHTKSLSPDKFKGGSTVDFVCGFLYASILSATMLSPDDRHIFRVRKGHVRGRPPSKAKPVKKEDSGAFSITLLNNF